MLWVGVLICVSFYSFYSFSLDKFMDIFIYLEFRFGAVGAHFRPGDVTVTCMAWFCCSSAAMPADI